MVLDPNIMKAVERLDYRVTPGDVAALAGLDVRLAEQGLLALASETGGHLDVSDAGEIAYSFPNNFRSTLQNKYLRLRLQQWLSTLWQGVFYLIRISFGIVLIISIVLILVTIAILLLALSASRGEGSDDNDGGAIFMPHIWFGPDLFWIFSSDYGDRSYQRRQLAERGEAPRLNFLESIFSFLFGDGNPNADLEERRWRTVGTVIRNSGGAVVAEQIAPYLEVSLSEMRSQDENYMLPVLTRFNGRPEVSPDGDLVYHFPELQVMATERRTLATPAYLKESLWRFSAAGTGQIALAIALGVFNLGGAITLGILLGNGAIAAQIGGLVAFVNAIYVPLLAYGSGFLGIPLLRYFWLRRRNAGVARRNTLRQSLAEAFNQSAATLQGKLQYARQFATQTLVDRGNLAYTTETDLVEQELAQKDKIDAEWQQRLERSES